MFSSNVRIKLFKVIFNNLLLKFNSADEDVPKQLSTVVIPTTCVFSLIFTTM